MAVNGPIFDSGPSSSRKDVKTVIAKRVPVPPPLLFNSLGGVRVEVFQDPERVGQFVYHAPLTPRRYVRRG